MSEQTEYRTDLLERIDDLGERLGKIHSEIRKLPVESEPWIREQLTADGALKLGFGSLDVGLSQVERFVTRSRAVADVLAAEKWLAEAKARVEKLP